ncbi:NACHT domain-containing protein [Fusarium falciforme]|uniref:NACHT domain-containing protein n=1 Tax=Fusarium falciforme TaxID=195108 RepID=UPI00230178DD|nr:NACHT domain-containing protein [Fusarium falciforme]WAO84597.1 NACHT domain-containing protein [Fusarium falciforme]
MPDLEPLAALGLACSVMQTLTFAGQTLSLCKKIYNDGQPDPALNDYGLELTKISETLKNNLNTGSGVLSSDDLALRDTAEKCLEVATNLAQEMQNLSPQNGQKGVRISIRLGFKTVFRKSRLEQLEISLRNIQSTMNTQLLVRTLNRVDASTIEQQGVLTDSRRLLQDTIQQCSSKNENKLDLIAQGNTETRDQLLQAMNNAQSRVEAHIKSESSKNTQLLQTQITTVESSTQRQFDQFQEWKDKQNEEVNYQRLLQSLKFESMEERKNQITGNYPQTYRWIFEEPDEEPDEEPPLSEWTTVDEDDSTGGFSPRSSPNGEGGHWDSFVDWLESKCHIYWISGKPGSGKSTLMKFVSSNPKTKRLLGNWQSEVQIFSHYFWKAGSEMQQSLKGLLCSLMYQIFCENRQMALNYLHKTRGICQKPSSNADWDTEKLEALLQNCVSESKSGICLFIDGLDEFSPQADYHDLLFLLDRLSGPRVKLCLSSRPEQVLRNHLQVHANLRMQDLTENDMRKYAAGCLRRAISPTDQKLHIKAFVDFIICRADGVFLWVVLVSKSLARGIENGDSDAELRQRLESMPGDLAALYKDMWSRLNDDRGIYQKSSSWFFNIIFAAEYTAEKTGRSRTLKCLKQGSVSVFELMAATDATVLDRFLDRGEEFPTAEIDKRCSHVARAVEIRSAGLLEVSNELSRGNSLEHYADMQVLFIHRTARDFLLENEDGRRLWQTREISVNDARTRLIRACLLRCHVWPFLQDTGQFPRYRELSSFLLSASRTVDKDGVPPEDLTSAIEGAYETRRLWSDFVRMGLKARNLPRRDPELIEAEFLLWAGLSGLVRYTAGRIPQVQPRIGPGVVLGALLYGFCARVEDHGDEETVYEDRGPLIQCLLQQGAAPNGNNDALTSPWVLYLSTTFNRLSWYRAAMRSSFRRKASGEVPKTLRAFLEAGASLLGNIPVLVSLTGTQLSYKCVQACPEESPFATYDPSMVILSVNHVWLINGILEQLDPEANVANIGHEQVQPCARVVMAAHKANIQDDRPRCWSMPDEDASKITAQIVSRLRGSARVSTMAREEAMRQLQGMMSEVKGRSKLVDEDEVPRFFREGKNFSPVW